jgi:hypothetical protein
MAQGAVFPSPEDAQLDEYDDVYADVYDEDGGNDAMEEVDIPAVEIRGNELARQLYDCTKEDLAFIKLVFSELKKIPSE